MHIEQRDFVLAIGADTNTVISIAHEGLALSELDVYYKERQGLHTQEEGLAAIVSDINRESMAVSLVRGLLPRKLCDYNRLRNYRNRNLIAFQDERLAESYERYHACIETFLTAAAHRHRKAYLIDLHAFRAEGYERKCDIVLGTRNSTTTPDGMDRACAEFFTKWGFGVYIAPMGEKFSGGITIGKHKKEQTETLQIEISTAVTHSDPPGLRHDFAAALRAFVLSLNVA